MSTPIYYVYILQSEVHDRYYVGQTSEILTRFSHHNSAENTSYTRDYQPWTLVGLYIFASRADALWVERYIKNKKSRSFISHLISRPYSQEYLDKQLSRNNGRA